MQLLQEKFEFTNDRKEVITGVRYYVMVCGIKIYLSCKDSTAKQLLDNNYKGEINVRTYF